MFSIPQSTSYVCMFKAFLSSDHVSEATSKTIAITISKNGGAFGNPNAGATNATEVSSGWYKVTLDTTDTGTVGPLAVRGAVAAVDDVGVLLNVVSATTGGLTNLDTTVSSRLASASYTAPTNLTAAQIATGVWQDTTAGDFTTALSVGKSLMNGVSLGTGLTVARCTLTDTLTTYTGNTVQTGDAFARLGVAGVGLTNLGDTRIANLDVAVSGRMATYTQPTGFLAATFPNGTIANTTNITAGTITTTANLTTNNDKTGYALTAGYDRAKTAAQAGDAMALTSGERNSTADALLDRSAGVETNRTPRQTLRLMAAVLLGKASGLATTTATYRDTNDSKDRIVATVDTDGNRSAVTLDAS